MGETATTGGTVGKAFDVLDSVASLGRPVRFSELLASSPHPRATLYRLLQTLTTLGLLHFDAQRQTYTPGLRLVRLAHAAWKQSSLAPLARPYIDALSAQIEETVHLGQLDGGQVLYVDKRNASQPVEMFSQAGKVGPGYCTGIGKAMLAFLAPEQREQALRQQAYFRYTPATIDSAERLRAELDEIRVTGIAYDREEHEPGIICIAAPILAERRVIGGLSVTATTSRHRLEDLDRIKPQLLDTAGQIGDQARNWQFPGAS